MSLGMGTSAGTPTCCGSQTRGPAPPPLQQFSLWHPPTFGVHALACLEATDTLKRELQTRLQRQNENCCPPASALTPTHPWIIVQTACLEILSRSNELWTGSVPAKIGT